MEFAKEMLRLSRIGREHFCLIAVPVIALSCAAVVAQTISATEAAKHTGEQATVCGRIASEHTATSSKGTPTFINLDKPYPNQVFTVLIWGSDKASAGNLPSGGQFCAKGKITEYRGTPEIVIHTAQDWYVPKN